MKRIHILIALLMVLFTAACNNKKDPHASHKAESQETYTCPMHPQIIRDKPGQCPICKMDLVIKVKDGEKLTDTSLNALLKPTNEFVVSSIPVTTIHKKEEPIEIQALGTIAYDTRRVGVISSRVSGRIEKLYVRYRYQKISKGQRVFDIYSPELLTAQQNLLFLLTNDASNTGFIRAAKEKLLLLGMSNQQMQQVIKSGNPALTIAVYSNFSGHVHEASTGVGMNTAPAEMNDIALITEELSIKEGIYVQKGQSIFTVFNPDRAWVLLNIYGENQGMVKTGNRVDVTPENAANKNLSGKIDFIEPFYRKENKTLTARVHFNNSELKIPIGSQIKAIIFGNSKEANWLPGDAVLSLGMGKVVFIKNGDQFKAKRVETGYNAGGKIQILKGLTITDSVAVNAQFLMDSEGLIKINKL